MYSKSTSLVLGFHGCDESVRDLVLKGAEMIQSHKEYDWLGHGTYFWEADPTRAYEWAVELSEKPNSQVKKPAVIGAVIDLGKCLDTSNRQSIKTMQQAYLFLKKLYDEEGKPLPKNENIANNRDWIKRNLDCAVIEMVHDMMKTKGLPAFDSVKSMFAEGDAAYEGSGFKEKTHTQICVINPNCIKGVFVPRTADKMYPIP